MRLGTPRTLRRTTTMTAFKTLGLATLLLGAAVVGGTIIGSVAASTSLRTDPAEPRGAAASRPPAGVAGDACADFRRAFATNLGVDESALAPAARAAARATVDAAVADGRLAAAAGERLKTRIERAAGDGCVLFAGRLARVAADVGAVRDVAGAAAPALGMTPAELRQQLRSGATLQALADAHGVPYATVSAAIVAAVKADLDAAVAAGRIAQARADRILERLERNLAEGRLRDARPVPSDAPGS
jgi:hypothetical protein